MSEKTADDRRTDHPVNNELNLIFVFAGSADMAQDIRNLLEFMDTHCVEIAEADAWQEQLNDRTLSAVFLAPDVADETRELLLDDIGRLDSDISVVVVNPKSEQAA